MRLPHKGICPAFWLKFSPSSKEARVPPDVGWGRTGTFTLCQFPTHTTVQELDRVFTGQQHAGLRASGKQ